MPETDDKLRLTEILEKEQGVTRLYHTWDRWFIGAVCLGWALFQLSLPRLVILDSITIRALHLAFAITIVFLGIPASKKRKKDIPFIHSKKRIPPLDYLLALIAAVAVLYLVLDWEGISMRAGRPIAQDTIFGLVVILVLLEGARRAIGLPMVVVAIIFTIYAFAGPYMPRILAFRGVSLAKYMSQIALSTEGIYGIPLDVSARTVYLFVLFGALLERLGAGQFFNDLAISLLGRFKGGPAKAAVVSSGFTGLVSGSSIANVVTTGTFTIPLMQKVGYPGKTAAATEVAASTNGQLMPPIMGAAAFIIAEYLALPYFEVVKAAVIPAVVSYIALFYITHLEASKLDLRGLPPEECPRFSQVVKEGFHHLIPVVILIYELAWMRRTPNLAVFNAIVILLVVALIRNIYADWKKGTGIGHTIVRSIKTFGEGMIVGSQNMLPVALATATAGIIVGVVNMGIGSLIVQVVERMAMGNVFLLLFITAIVSLVIGMGLPTTATYIVMASITVPVILQIGGDMGFVIPAIAAHLFCFYFGILADDTPPVGLAAYAAAAIAKSDPIPTGIKGFIYDLRTAAIPFVFVFNADLLLEGVTSFWVGIVIFVGTTFGALAFTNAVQGWGIVENRWFEFPLFLLASTIFFLPNVVAGVIGLDFELRHLIYFAGGAVYALTFLLQKLRSRGSGGAVDLQEV
ncbi:MAG: TRAP transporter permease [Alkalispirochaetaceae bacterium]